MSYTNLDIRSQRLYEDLYKNHILLQAECDYYRKELKCAQGKLENIPEAIKDYGYIDIIYDNNQTIRLIADKTRTNAVLVQEHTPE